MLYEKKHTICNNKRKKQMTQIWNSKFSFYSQYYGPFSRSYHFDLDMTTTRLKSDWLNVQLRRVLNVFFPLLSRIRWSSTVLQSWLLLQKINMKRKYHNDHLNQQQNVIINKNNLVKVFLSCHLCKNFGRFAAQKASVYLPPLLYYITMYLILAFDNFFLFSLI